MSSCLPCLQEVHSDTCCMSRWHLPAQSTASFWWLLVKATVFNSVKCSLRSSNPQTKFGELITSHAFIKASKRRCISLHPYNCSICSPASLPARVGGLPHASGVCLNYALPLGPLPVAILFKEVWGRKTRNIQFPFLSYWSSKCSHSFSVSSSGNTIIVL